MIILQILKIFVSYLRNVLKRYKLLFFKKETPFFIINYIVDIFLKIMMYSPN